MARPVVVERGAGARAFYGDALYETAGATLADAAAVYDNTDVVVKVQRPSPAEVARLRRGTLLISLLAPASNPETVHALLGARRGGARPRARAAHHARPIHGRPVVASDRLGLQGGPPRRVDAAKSCHAHDRSRNAPARVFVMGAGVAGLQAIATARRLGAVVSAFDVRAAAQEQIESGRGSSPPNRVGGDAEGAGGYAKAQSEEQARRTREGSASTSPTWTS